MSPTTTKQAVHFGAGNIGRGFIGPLLSSSGYHVIFADVDEPTITKLNAHDSYDVHILDSEPTEPKQNISNVSGVLSTQPHAPHSIADPETQLITTAVGPPVLPKIAPTIARGLSARRAVGAGGLNLIACENKVGATSALREEVVKALSNDEDRKWVEENVGFANCSVDRIVPPFDPSETDDAGELDVGVEGFYEWVVEAPALKEPKPEVGGMKMTDNLLAYVERKLYTLNTGHAIAAYLGYLRGLPTIDAAIEDSDIRAKVLEALEESGAALVKKHNFSEVEHKEYVAKIEGRFKNPELKDDVVRVGRQPLRKLGREDRLVGPAAMCAEYGLGRGALLRGVAAALLYDDEGDEQAKELKERIGKEGVESVVKDVTGFEKEDVDGVLQAYEELKKWRK